MAKTLLYLVHRLPYPPNKGDKISSFNMLRFFSERAEGHWRVFLGTFIDDPDDWRHQHQVRDLCEEAHILALPKHKKITGALSGLLRGEALSLSYYASNSMQAWVSRILEREQPDAILVFSGAMARFLPKTLASKTRFLFDPEDVDSEKWRGYAPSRPWPVSALYRREARKLLAFERAMAARAHVSIFVSAEEADLFKSLAPESAAKIHFRTQGVDTTFFDPGLDFPSPYSAGTKTMVFTGAMDYWPNIEAVTWFANQVFPDIRQADPSARFFIVGMKPSPDVRRLQEQTGIHVTGSVDDVRPYLAHAHFACLPLRTARGIQNKALEAMAMQLPIVATTAAMLGIIGAQNPMHRIAESPSAMVEAALAMLAEPRQHNQQGRQSVLTHYNWDTNLKCLEAHLTPR
jgi:sugar transferase (PEP-CTERM/EpsH1 system associated)